MLTVFYQLDTILYQFLRNARLQCIIELFKLDFIDAHCNIGNTAAVEFFVQLAILLVGSVGYLIDIQKHLRFKTV